MCDILYNKITDARLFILTQTVKELLNKKNAVIISIDGKCASGKSTLAKEFKDIYDCNIFHVDDFYLPFKKRSSQRLEKPGGNIETERLISDVLLPLKEKRSFYYRRYNCSTASFSEELFVCPKCINIVEGSYSNHPDLRRFYDFRIFIDINKEEQKRRILQRNPERSNDFFNIWIPYEEKYFKIFDIKRYCDLIL